MPAPIAEVGQVLQIRVVCMLNQQIGINVLHYEVTASEAGGHDLLQIAGELAGAFQQPYKNWLAPDATFVGVDVKRIGVGATIPYSSNADQGPGEGAGATMPPQIAAVISTKASLAGKKYQGRVYIPFVPTGVSAGMEPGEVSDAAAALLGAIALELGPTITISTDPEVTTLALLTSTEAPIAAKRVEQIVVRRLLGTQRRRGLFSASNLPPF